MSESQLHEQAYEHLKETVRKQGHKLMEAEELLTFSLQLFKDVQGGNPRFVAKMEREGRKVCLDYSTTAGCSRVCEVSRSPDLGKVYVGDGKKCNDFHGSHFVCDTKAQLVKLIERFLLTFCASQGIKKL